MNQHAPKYAVVIEKAASNYSAYVPDLPGCVATGDSIAEIEAEISAAIRFHLDGMRQDGHPIPSPSCQVHYVEAD
ncbi:MAG: type II toxin-antitoxin system HicB family antitoxin [Cyanobacteriota bacterium]|jgi:predicted RNase H-like HicB family nuclease